MITKGIWVGLVAIAFVAGSIAIGTTADAAPKGDTPAAFFDVFFDVFTVDSFFDVFTELQTNDEDQQASIDSFFDVTVDLQEQIDGLVGPSDIAAVNYFITIPGIPGESTDEAHKEWIDVLSVSHGLHSTSVGPGPGGGGFITDDISVGKQLDKSTPKLQEAIANGVNFDEVTIEFVKTVPSGERVTYYVYELKNVQVSSFSISGSSEPNSVPTENFSLNFEEIKVTYTEFDKDGNNKGNVETTWIVEEGEA